MSYRTRTIALLVATAALLACLPVAAAFSRTPAKAAASKTIFLQRSSFSPASLTVSRGTALRFTWATKMPHNVYGAGIAIPNRTSGTVTRTATRSGTLVCTLHPGMKLKLKVR